jgi:hypothetical protein
MEQLPVRTSAKKLRTFSLGFYRCPEQCKLVRIFATKNNFLKNESQTSATLITKRDNFRFGFYWVFDCTNRFHIAFSIPLRTDNNTVRENAMRVLKGLAWPHPER